MDLLLIRPNDQKNVYGDVSKYTACEPPFWAAQIAAYVREQGISVRILDAEALNLSPTAVYKEIGEASIVGILVTGTNLSASTWKMHGAKILVNEIKYTNPTIPIFLWGLHPSALPEQTMQEMPVDFVIRGENFASVETLTKYVNDCSRWDNIPGLFYRDSMGTIHGNYEIKLQNNMDNLPLAAWDLLPMEKYRAHNWHRMGETEKYGGYGIIATSLGCPFSCSFCAVSALFDQNKVRYRSAESVADEIGVLVNRYGVHYIKIIDECFVLNREHVIAVCNKLIERNYDINAWAYARIDTVDADLLKKLAEAKIKWICYGIESINNRSMEDVKKAQYDKKKIRDVIRMTHDAGLYVIANYMFGLPDDDDVDSMKETLAFARELNCEWINLYSTMAYPGSKLYFDCVKNNIPLPENWLGYSQFSYGCVPLPTKYISGKEVLAFRDYAFNAFFENNDAYFAMIREKFGEDAVMMIKNMLGKKLKRKLLER